MTQLIIVVRCAVCVHSSLCIKTIYHLYWWYWLVVACISSLACHAQVITMMNNGEQILCQMAPYFSHFLPSPPSSGSAAATVAHASLQVPKLDILILGKCLVSLYFIVIPSKNSSGVLLVSINLVPTMRCHTFLFISWYISKFQEHQPPWNSLYQWICLLLYLPTLDLGPTWDLDQGGLKEMDFLLEVPLLQLLFQEIPASLLDLELLITWVQTLPIIKVCEHNCSTTFIQKLI